MGRWLLMDHFFLMGLGFDLSGAAMLASSVILSASQIYEVSMPRWGWSAPLLVSRAIDRIKGVTGAVLLLMGFALQATGYLLNLGRRSDVARSGAAATIGLALLLACVAAGFAAYLIASRVFIKPLLVAVALQRPDETLGNGPNSELLRSMGALRWPVFPDETDEAYCVRVFGVGPGA